jgi:hypothetical protein
VLPEHEPGGNLAWGHCAASSSRTAALQPPSIPLALRPIDEQSFGPDHPEVAIRLNNLAQLLKATNRLAEAEPLMARMVAIFCRFTRATGHPHPHLTDAIGNYWQLLEAMQVPERERLQKLRAAGVDPAWLS